MLKLKKNKYYLITCEWLDDITCEHNYKYVAKFLGYMDRRHTNASFETNVKNHFYHNGVTLDRNSGKTGYCIYLSFNTFKIIKELTPEEVMIEIL